MVKYNNLIIPCFFLISSTVFSETLEAQWAKSVVQGPLSSIFKSINTDGNGNIYAVGSIAGGSYDFGNGVTVTHYGDPPAGIVLVKYNSNGNAQWAKGVERGDANSGFNSVDIDREGSIYAVGVIENAQYLYDVMIIKYSGAGDAQWEKSIDSCDDCLNSVFNSVATDDNGNIYAVGSITGGVTYGFGNGVDVKGAYPNDDNAVLVNYSFFDGYTGWAKSVVDGSGLSSFMSVAVDKERNIYAVGYIQGSGTYDFGNGVTVNGGYSGSINTLLIKYDSNGNAQWAKSVVHSSHGSEFFSIAVDGNGDIYAVGNIMGNNSCDFGNGVAVKGSSKDGINVVLVKYDNQGKAQWAKSVTSGADSSAFNSVSVDGAGDVYASGYITGTHSYDFGNGKKVSGVYGGGTNAIIVQYDNKGKTLSAKSVKDGPDQSEFYAVTTGNDKKVYTAGFIHGSGNYKFGNKVEVSGSSQDDYNIVLLQYRDESWWQKNRIYVFIGIGGFVGVTGAIGTAISCAPCLCLPFKIQGHKMGLPIRVLMQFIGTGAFIHVGIPLVGNALTPKSIISDNSEMEGLIMEGGLIDDGVL